MREASPIDELADAARSRALIAFTYASEGSHTARHAEPYRLVVHKKRTFLLAWDVDRDDWRTFRIDRMAGLTRSGGYEPREIPGDAAAIHQDDGTPPIRATLRFDSTPAGVADRLLTQEVELEWTDAGECRVLIWGHSYEWIAAIILSMGMDFRIDGPEEFRDHCVDLRDRLERAVHPGDD